MNRGLCASLLRRARPQVAAALFGALAACSGGLSPDDPPDRAELLKNNLSVAAAALAAGQPEVARRLYLSLAERFDDAPEPVLGLGYIAFRANDFVAAENRFLEAAELARDMPEARAEALLRAGRAALTRGAVDPARNHLREAYRAGKDRPQAAWARRNAPVRLRRSMEMTPTV